MRGHCRDSAEVVTDAAPSSRIANACGVANGLLFSFPSALQLRHISLEEDEADEASLASDSFSMRLK